MSSSKNIVEMFFEVSHASPNQVSIEINEQIWTYGELLMNVISLAGHLHIEIGEIIYQYVDRSLEMVCGLLAILYVGGTYCPLNPTESSSYICTLIEAIPGQCVLIHANTHRRFSNTISRTIPMIHIDRILLIDNVEEIFRKPINLKDDNPSFVIVTSSIMKRPAAIVHTHASLIENLQYLIQWSTTHGDKVLQVVETSWIIHMLEILMPLITIPSGTLVLLPPEGNFNIVRFCNIIKDKQITLLFIDPSLIKTLLEYLELHNQQDHNILKQVRIMWTLNQSIKSQYQSQLELFAPQTRIYLMYDTNTVKNPLMKYEMEKELINLNPSLVTKINNEQIISSWMINTHVNYDNRQDTRRYSSTLPCTNHSYCLIVNKPVSKSMNHNRLVMGDKKNYHSSLPISVNYINEKSPSNETDCFLSVDNLSIHSNDLPFPGLIEKAFCCLRQTTFPRYQCLKLITWPWFERLTLLVILLNCITLGLYQPCPSTTTEINSSQKCTTKLCVYLHIIDQCIFAYFTLEMFIRIIAMGLIGKGTYLAESWNRLDCFIVITGWIELFLPGDNVSLSAIRTVRVLRPLRAINNIPSMRILVMLILDTLPILGNVLLLYFFLFAIFGIIGVQLWKGVLRNRCFLELNSSIINHYYHQIEEFSFHPFYIPSDDRSFICSNSLASGTNKCSDIPRFRQDNITCQLSLNASTNQTIHDCINWNQYYQTCNTSDENPFSGAIHFDNMIYAWLAIFQIISLENWVEIMYYIQDAHSFWDWIYFFCLTIIGSFFMMNICLAVISAQFGITKQREIELIHQQKSCWEAIIKYFERSIKRLQRRFTILWKNSRSKHDQEKEYCLPCKRFRKFIAYCVHSKYFDLLIFCAIIANTLSMSVEYHGQPQSLTNILEYINYVFVILFTLEMFLKLLADGCWNYIKNPLNIFDCTIVIISLVELYGTQHSGLSVLRTFRLLRVLKLIQFAPTLRKQFMTMIKTLDNVATFFLLLILFIFIFSILGMHLFGGQFCILQGFNRTSRQQFTTTCRCCSCPEVISLKNSTNLRDVICSQDRPNFDSLRSASLTVFQILTQEDWNEVLYNAMERTNSWAAVYFIGLMIFGNYVLLNLFVAILVEGFISDKNEEDNPNEIVIDPFQIEAIITGDIQPHRSILHHQTQTCPSLSEEYSTAREGNLLEEEEIHNGNTTLDSYETANDYTNFEYTSDLPQSINEQNSLQIDQSNQKNIQTKTKSSCWDSFCQLELCQWFRIRHNYSLYLLSPTNKFRIKLQDLVGEKAFDSLILLCIGINSIALAMERPSISPLSLERKFLTWGNYVFTVIFTIEMIIKILADGLFIGRRTYLRNNWNRMDAFLVVISIVDLIIADKNTEILSTESDATSHILGMLRVFRLLRTLRPLRVINRAPGLKLVIETLLSSVKPIGHVMIICLVFFIIFAILGVQLFKGKFYYCDGSLADTISTKQECLNLPEHVWINQKYNFDNLIQALLTLFVLSSKDAWVSIMYNGIDAVGVDMQPKKNFSEGKFLYFVAFILTVGFFVVNIFVGVIVENFQSCRVELDRQEEARLEAKRLKDFERKQLRLRDLRDIKDYSSWRKGLYNLCRNKNFDIAIAVIIVLNVITMSVEFYQMPMWLEKVLEYCNYVFTMIFFVEFLWKIVALGSSRYFHDNWNRFDAFVVFLSIIGIGIDKMNGKHVLPINPTLIRTMRLLRIARSK
ncbi:hypothetical protein I4U23_000269 [Adineta vaga]|nr:hypothetical protein I4U23_000269 [Adineta vaga]